jgi:thiamine-phosphate diphosphorylase
VRPLPRVLAYTNDEIARREDFGILAAALAAAGPAVALVARAPDASADALTALADRCVRLARAPEAMVLVSGRADIAAASDAHGVILRGGDIAVADARQLRRPGGLPLLVYRSVHDLAAAEEAAQAGADALIVGTIWPSASHPGHPGAGTALLKRCAALGLPTYAIGGVTPERAREAIDCGAWGVAAISALWDAPKPYLAMVEMVGAAAPRGEEGGTGGERGGERGKVKWEVNGER